MTISWKLLATKSGCLARCAATIKELNAAGGGSTFFASICNTKHDIKLIAHTYAS